MRLLVLLLLIASCRTTASNTASINLADTADDSSRSAFISAFRSYLSFYSKSHYAAAAAANPDLKTVLFGALPGPYELQMEPGQTIDRLIAQTNFAAPVDPDAPNTIGCAPTFLQAASGVAYRGSIILLHGFSACPMQFFEYGAMLARNGYDIFIPLLPGNGRAPIPLGKSPSGSAPLGTPPNPDLGGWYGDYLPTYVEEDRYFKFGTYLNDMIAKLPGDHFVAGLSGGGALAHYMALERPGLYKRALLLSPFYHQRPHTPPDPLLDNEPVFDSKNPPTDARFLGFMDHQRPFGQYCYRNTYNGRRGICDAKIKGALGLNRFAAKMIAQLKASAASGDTQAWPQIQVISVENDTGSDTPVTRQVFAIQKQAKPESSSLCFWGIVNGQGIPHAFVSKYDNSGADLFWLPTFYTESLSYFGQGQPFREGDVSDAESKGGPPYKYCAVDEEQ